MAPSSHPRCPLATNHALVAPPINLSSLYVFLSHVIGFRSHIFPADFIVIPVLFYIVVTVAGLSLDDLRKHGWLFDLGGASQEAWYKMYSYLGSQSPFSLGFWHETDSFSRFQCGALECHLGHFAYAICFVSVFFWHESQVYVDCPPPIGYLSTFCILRLTSPHSVRIRCISVLHRSQP